MAYEFKLPDLGEGLTEGEIARWLVKEGQVIAEDDPLVEVQTDKTTVEIPSPAAGLVARILAQEGDVVPVGTVIVVIGATVSPGDGPSVSVADAGETVRAPTPPTSEPRQAGCRPRRSCAGSPRSSASISPTSTGSGPGGRITEDDVRLTAGGTPAARREPLRGVRRLIAEHMARAHREVAPVTWVEECDFSKVDLGRLVATLLKACALSLKEFPELNARFDGDAIFYLDHYDLGVAVQTDAGLVVPVVRGCDHRPVDELDADVRRLAEGARAGTLAAEELRGSTFTVTSAGKLAGLFQTPIVNHPEVAILSVGRIADRPVVRDGQVTVAPIGYIALTFDHRVVDGARAAAFGLDVIRRLEE